MTLGMALSFMLTAVMIDTIILGGGWEALSGVIIKLIGGKSRLEFLKKAKSTQKQADCVWYIWIMIFWICGSYDKD